MTLMTPGPTLVVTERGGPVPPQDVIARMRAEVGPEFSLKWRANFDNSHWDVARDWPQADARWSRVRCGEIPSESAYDIIGSLPLDCPLEQASDYLRKALKAYPIEEIRKLSERVTHWNDVEVPKQQVAQIVTDTLDSVNQANKPKWKFGMGKR